MNNIEKYLYEVFKRDRFQIALKSALQVGSFIGFAFTACLTIVLSTVIFGQIHFFLGAIAFASSVTIFATVGVFLAEYFDN